MNNLIKLNFISKLHESLNREINLVHVILGPRQVGKTTSIIHYLEHEYGRPYHYMSADRLFNATPEWLVEQWELARRQKCLLVIDEIQKVHNWAEIVKKLWDEGKRNKNLIQCVLLGSSSLEIQKGLTESLTGRFLQFTAYHWNYYESKMGYGLGFEDYLKFGGYPGSYPFINTSDWTPFVSGSIIGTVIEKDILQYQSIKSPALFKQAFEILISYPAMEISYTKLLGQLQSKGNVELIKHYVSLYQGAFLLRALEKYSPSALRVKTSSPKIIPMAPCFYFLTNLDHYNSEERGRIFEGLVGAQLIRTGEKVFYWREGNHEVDFIVVRGKRIWAIEVKSGRRKREGGVEAFKKLYPQAQVVFITRQNYEQFELDPMAFLVD